MACIGVGAARSKQPEGLPEKCKLPPDDGPCRARIPSFYFDYQDTKKCREFMYGGCEGNANNFETLDECQKECPARNKTKRRGTKTD
uniref:Putative salivary kunitz domain protein n=1 Tax=Ixodes ricinus TaxID=34613 RepID=A0A0K8RML4_IXORI